MSLVSLERKQDNEVYHDLMSIIGTALDSYHRTENPALLSDISYLMERAECLKLQTQGDYTERDAMRERVNKIIGFKE